MIVAALSLNHMREVLSYDFVYNYLYAFISKITIIRKVTNPFTYIIIAVLLLLISLIVTFRS